MNLPNKLTLLRVILIPFFLLFMYIDFPFHYAVALVIFAAASITDALDGKIARNAVLSPTLASSSTPSPTRCSLLPRSRSLSI